MRRSRRAGDPGSTPEYRGCMPPPGHSRNNEDECMDWNEMNLQELEGELFDQRLLVLQHLHRALEHAGNHLVGLLINRLKPTSTQAQFHIPTSLSQHLCSELGEWLGEVIPLLVARV